MSLVYYFLGRGVFVSQCSVSCNRELYRIVRPCNYRGQQHTGPGVILRVCCLRLKLHEGVLARLIQVFTAVVNELIRLNVCDIAHFKNYEFQ